MDCSARMFLCARCRDQVLVCSDCDRGQRYCTRTCSGLVRRAARRDAARRYQRSRGGRVAHAARSRRWRIRQHRVQAETTCCEGVNIVTHQGSIDAPADAPLGTCTSDSTAPNVTADAGFSEGVSVASVVAAGRCRRCGAALTPWVRQGFLRHSTGVRAARHDHSP